MRRNSTVKGTTKVIAAQPNDTSDYSVAELIKIKPLPQGRPIATNASTGIAELLGYLD
ncbi:MAG: hypothetical protein JOZ78_05035 [Chroococcidiopsidaceae cyanobacterium CP_BM_ER_R8_30]|nr:hypothetical protein [Chroococcidiopsidaceae cyanobacterium CP_BM_ER_R8_30]